MVASKWLSPDNRANAKAGPGSVNLAADSDQNTTVPPKSPESSSLETAADKRRWLLLGLVAELADLVSRLRGQVAEAAHRGNDGAALLHAKAARAALKEAIDAASAMTFSRERGDAG